MSEKSSSDKGDLSSYDSSDEDEDEDEYEDSCSENENCEGYINEPEYTEKEMKSLGLFKESSEDSSSSSSSDDDSRLENLHWCSCTRCVITFTMKREECICCCEYQDLLGKKMDDLKCITLNKEFHTLCLNKTVLETSAICERRHRKTFKEVDSFSQR